MASAINAQRTWFATQPTFHVEYMAIPLPHIVNRDGIPGRSRLKIHFEEETSKNRIALLIILSVAQSKPRVHQ
ncbi:hypothetical protein [Paraburkholderia sp. JHI869]|uniref:hypothetical protein n=1 Tax=Paraburkholderia sp. JHI869 TaxID=3112959 RepID=UPI00319DF867